MSDAPFEPVETTHGPAVVDPANLEDQEGNAYETRGRTKVATPKGYAYRGSDLTLPEVTSAGVFMTKDQAEALVEESDAYGGRVYIVTDETEED